MKRIISIMVTIVLMVVFTSTSIAITSIPVKSIKLNSTSITIQVGKTYSLKATLTPTNTTQKLLIYSTANKNIATVDKNGVIKAVKVGKTIITAISNSNKKVTAKCTVTVTQGSDINFTGLPLVKGTQTLKIGAVIDDGDPSNKDIKFWKIIQNQTNVAIDWQDTLKSAWNDKKGLMMASGDLPEAFIGGNFTDTDLLIYGYSGKIIPIEQYIDTCMPNFSALLKKHPEWKSEITAPNGHIYGVPSIDLGAPFTTQFVQYINQKWLDNLNLKMPTTTDELEQILKAFKDKDPNGNGKPDEIPFTFVSPMYVSDWLQSFGVYDNPDTSKNDTHMFVKSGKVGFSAVQPGYKEGIKWLHKLFTEGLIDPEGFTQDGNAFDAKTNSPVRITGLFEGWRGTQWRLSADDKEYAPMPPVKSPIAPAEWPKYKEGSGIPIRSGFVLTSLCKKPELALRWADNLLTDDNSLQINTSQLIGEHLEKTADNRLKQIRPIDWNRPGEASLMTHSKLYIYTSENANRQLKMPPVVLEKGSLDKLFAPYLPKTVSYLPDIFYDLPESQKLTQYRSDINPYVKNQYAKWIMQGGIDTEWDGYVKKLNDMGLNDMIGIYQKALDKQNSHK